MPTSTRMSKKEKLNFLADIEDGYRPFDRHALALLRSLLDDADAQVRAEAIACLWNDPDPKWIDVLTGKATDDVHAVVRAHAISALGRYIFEGEAASYEGWDNYDTGITREDYERVTEFLLRTAQDSDEALETRRYAIEALAFRGDDAAVLDLIEWAYHHRDRRLKASAIFSMARNGDKRWTDYILAEMQSADAEIQYEAVHAAGQLGLPEATDTLIGLAQSKEIRKPLRLLAIHALGETGDERAYPVLDRLSRARDRDVREVAREAMDDWMDIRAMEGGEDFDEDEFELEGVDEFAPDIWDDAMGTFSRN
jgi:HEAT repeat protein